MTGTAELLNWWGGWQTAIEELLRGETARDKRATGITALLRPLMSTVCACRLNEDDSPYFAVEAAQPATLKRWTKSLTETLGRLGPLTEVTHLPPLTRGDKGVSLAIPIAARGKSWGCLVLGLDEEHSDEALALVKTFLSMAARTLALFLHAETDTQSLERALRRRKEEEGLLLAGDAVTEVVHGINNILNRILLQAAIVQMHVPEDVREEVGVIRKEGAQAAALLRPLQQLRSEGMYMKSPLSLSRMVLSALTEIPNAKQRVETRFSEDGDEVTAEEGAMSRLLHLLIRTALGSLGPKNKLRVGTARKEGRVQLSLDPPGALASLATEEDDSGPGAGLLDHLAMRSLLRRSRGRLTLQATRKRVPQLVVEWAAG